MEIILCVIFPLSQRRNNIVYIVNRLSDNIPYLAFNDIESAKLGNGILFGLAHWFIGFKNLTGHYYPDRIKRLIKFSASNIVIFRAQRNAVDP